MLSGAYSLHLVVINDVRRGLVAAVKCCTKDVCFRCPGRLWHETREPRALCGFQHHKGENLCCFLFSDSIIVGLITAVNGIGGGAN